MSGDDKKRYCDKCQHHVHDLTGLTLEEIDILRTEHKGRLCGAFRLGATAALGASLLTLAACKTPDNDSMVVGEYIPPVTKTDSSNSSKPSKPKPEISTNDKSEENITTTDKAPPIEPPLILGMICPPEAPQPPIHED